jgi:hypothetical protein
MYMHQGILPVHNAHMDAVKEEISALAARMVVEEGAEYGPAKRRAAQQLGLKGRGTLPDNDLVEAAVRDYIAVFCADTQPGELRVLRQIALRWMEKLVTFRPHLTGAVWSGTATRLSDIYIQLFCDDSKSAEIALIDMGVRFEVHRAVGFRGQEVDFLSVHVKCTEFATFVGVHLGIYDFDDLRGALLPDSGGVVRRGDAAGLLRLLHDGGL